MIALRCVLLLLSFIGWQAALVRWMKPAFSQGVMFAVIAGVLFFGGAVGQLRAAAWIVCFAGLSCFAISVIRRQRFHWLLSFPQLVSAALGLFFLFTLYGLILTGYDDFSHWGVVARILVRCCRFPNSSDLHVAFQSYPLGSAVLIYYFSEITGVKAEWIWLWAQAVVTIGLFTGLLAFGKNRKENLFLLAVMLILMSSNIFFINLMVDTMITGCALCSMSFALYYRKQIKSKLFWLLPLMMLLVELKTSGIFFVIIILLYVFIELRKTRSTAAARMWPILFALSFIPLVIWYCHLHAAFPGAMSSNHAVSLEGFYSRLRRRPIDVAFFILVQMLRRVLSPELELLWLIVYAVLLLLINRSYFRENRMIRSIYCFVFWSGAAYMIVLYGTYLVAMSWYEASVVAGIERYLVTFTAFAAGVFSILLLVLSDELRKKAKWKGLVWAGLWTLVLLLTMGRQLGFWMPWTTETEPRASLEKQIQEMQIRQEKRYLIVREAPLDDDGYIYYMYTYSLNPEKIQFCTEQDLEDGKYLAEDYDYVLRPDMAD